MQTEAPEETPRAPREATRWQARQTRGNSTSNSESETSGSATLTPGRQTPSGLESLINMETSGVGNSSSKSVLRSSDGATPSYGIDTLSGLAPPITTESSGGGAARLAEATGRRRGNGPISLSRRDTGKSGGRQSHTTAPVRSDASWTVKVGGPTPTDSSSTRMGRIRRRACLVFLDHGASKLDWTELGTPYAPETGPPPMTQRLVDKSDNPSGKQDAVAHACVHDHDEPAIH